ncbi:fumarate hydratase C-terminal domain-containing protein [Clostridium sp. 'deep sea']|uniref:FumA C-terminus/TtdB family hydratase beta subunit n=1 Tax=Clostridium sp. 'deep sea' TaxID=2779445 RepID=UPI001896980D|nr:FumA C-terminus/TtdB family hydratase beta subunit [Clostridium sp. 'deep sea']QOR36226.1 fumarate hydratase C-terminal domain-containing protein [Clostridium sp. 'deep sea']
MKIKLPLTIEKVKELKVGQLVYLTGTVLTGRDAAHKRLVGSINNKEQLPIDLKNQTIYYVGPCPAPNDHIIGAAGPTTSARMDKFTIPLLQQGLIAMIGKGPRSKDIKNAVKQYGCVYFIACGGAGALLARKIEDIEVLAYHDLGTESVKQLTVKDFPVIVAIDSNGDSLFV